MTCENADAVESSVRLGLPDLVEAAGVLAARLRYRFRYDVHLSDLAPATLRTGHFESNWIEMSIFRRRPGPAADAPESPVSPRPAGTADTAEVRFALREARARIGTLEGDLDRARRAAEQRAATAVDGLAEAVATPLAHLATQVALVRAGGSVLTLDDLAASATRLVKALDRAGVTVDGEPGVRVAFDPARHVASGGDLAPGSAAVVRSPGVRSAGGRLVRKATVSGGQK